MRYYLPAILLLLLICYLLTGVTLVQPGELAVVRRFGRVLEDKPGPGLHIGLPWGIDRVDRVAAESLQRVVVGFQADDPDQLSGTLPPGQLLTGDQNLVNILVAVDYSVREKEIEDYVVQADRIDGLVSRATESALADWMAGRDVDRILLRGKAELPEWLAKEVEERILPYKLGISIKAVNVKELVEPQEVRSAFEEVTQAEAKKKQKINNASAEAEQKKQNAKTDEATIRYKADAKVTEKKQLAQADADRFTDRRLKNQRSLSEDRAALFKSIWWNEMRPLLQKLNENGQLQLLDHYLTSEGLDLTTFAPVPKKK